MGAIGRVWVWLTLGLVACGGRVEEPTDGQEEARTEAGDPSGGGEPGQGSVSGAACAGTKPHPDYSLCYETQLPPCLSSSSPLLREKFPSHAGAISGGPWVGASSSCRMLCCYAP